MPLLPGVMALIQYDGKNRIASYDATTGNFTQSQPDFTDISGNLSTAQLPTAGASGNIDLAPLTTLGTPGTITVVNGIITAFVNPT
jgi:hypothetical protein